MENPLGMALYNSGASRWGRREFSGVLKPGGSVLEYPDTLGRRFHPSTFGFSMVRIHG